MKNQLSDILFCEHSNKEHIHLYRTDNYWVAFERFAFHLCHIYAQSVINAMKVFRVPFPIVVASVEDREIPFAVGGMECRKEHL